MAEIKDIGAIAAKWARVTPQRQQDYQQGVERPRRDWARAAAAAQDVHDQAMRKAAQTKAYSRGVNEAGTSKWQAATLAKGPNRFAEGVLLAESEYRTRFGPFAEVIQRTPLPPRFPRGDSRNLERVRAIAQALHARKAGATA